MTGVEMRLKDIFVGMLKPLGKTAFFNKLKEDCRVLDVGCGNDSPLLFKTRFPGGHYTGVDVSDYRHSAPIMADAYHVTTSVGFAEKIAEFQSEFDAVTSSHNLEHCENREAVLVAMADALKPGGLLYLSFPSQASLGFPSRRGTLNYRDDDTHLADPPAVAEVIKLIERKKLRIIQRSEQYRPMILRIIGYFNERRSKKNRQVCLGTWEFYGFEAIIWAQKI
jgi:SAM-dependent methyltransferase